MAGPAAAGIWTEIPSGRPRRSRRSSTRATRACGSRRRTARSGSGAPTSAVRRVYGPSAIPFNDIEFQAGGDIGLAVGDAGKVVRRRTAGRAGRTWRASRRPTRRRLRQQVHDQRGSDTSTSSASPATAGVDRRRRPPAGDVQPAAAGTSAPRAAGSMRTAGRAGGRDNCWSRRRTRASPTCSSPRTRTCSTSHGLLRGGRLLDEQPRHQLQTSRRARQRLHARRPMVGDPATRPAVERVRRAVRQLDRAVHRGRLPDLPLVQRRERGEPSVPQLRRLRRRFAGARSSAPANAGHTLHVNGRDFYGTAADGALATQDWRAVGLASATQGVVGGVGGKLGDHDRSERRPDAPRRRPRRRAAGPAREGQPRLRSRSPEGQQPRREDRRQARARPRARDDQAASGTTVRSAAPAR